MIEVDREIMVVGVDNVVGKDGVVGRWMMGIVERVGVVVGLW